MIDRKNVFDQPVKNNKITYENIRKIQMEQEIQESFSFLRKQKKLLDFSQGTVKVSEMCYRMQFH